VTKAGEANAVAAVLVDFDGTACPTDVGDEVCARFAAGGWRALDEAAEARRTTLRQAIAAQTEMLEASLTEMLHYALERYAVDPSFVRFVEWARHNEVKVAVVSDGLGFYVQPMLDAAGLSNVPVLANRVTATGDGPRMTHPHAHPSCSGCGTCKVQAVLRVRTEGGAVALVGDGMSDRYGALFADIVFAKGRLAALCSDDGVPCVPWEDFHDVAAALADPACDGARRAGLPEAATSCPGWRAGAARETGGEM
jgi:2-hydroxy-3-keto-5-methylthiopentenyl-1-phosphate phosphatase